MTSKELITWLADAKELFETCKESGIEMSRDVSIENSKPENSEPIDYEILIILVYFAWNDTEKLKELI